MAERGRIREYTSPIDSLRPSDRGSDAAVRAGQTIGASYAQIGRTIEGTAKVLGDLYSEYQTRQELSNGLKTLAEIQANTTQAWNQTAKSADPNDPGTAAKFMEEQVEPILQAWSVEFQTKQGKAWAETQVAQLRQHFFEKTAADQATLAGTAAISNLTSFVASASNTVMNDPSSVNMTLGMVDQAIDALKMANPNLTPAQSAQMEGQLRTAMRKEVFASAFKGMARANPDAAQQALADGFGATDLDGSEREQLFSFAATIKRAQEADDKAAQAAAKQAAKDDFERKSAALAAAMFQPDGSIVVPAGAHQALMELATHPGVDRAAITALGNAMGQATESAINLDYRRTDNATWQGLASRIGIPPGDPRALTTTQVDQAYAAGKLAPTDYRFLRGAVQDVQSNPAQKEAAGRINDSLQRLKPLVDKSNLYSGRIDQSGSAQYDNLHYDVWQMYNSMVAGGMSPAQAADVLTDPRNPRGIQAMVPRYQTSNKEGLAVVRARTGAGGGPTPIPTPPASPLASQRKVGETPEEFLRRTGK